MYFKALIIFCLLFSFVACTSAKKRQENLTQINAALDPFQSEFKVALNEALRKGDIFQAIVACQTEAPKIPNAHTTDSLQLGRTSHRIRNPKNKPLAWMKHHLSRFKGKYKNEVPAEVVVDLPNGTGYLKPIFMKPVCLTCHGPNLADKTRAKIDQLYPNDKAKGFKLGEFRGFFWGRVKN